MPSISRYKRHSDSVRSATNLSHAGPSPRRVHPQYHLLGWFSLLIKQMSRTLSYKYSSKQGWVRIQATCPKSWYKNPAKLTFGRWTWFHNQRTFHGRKNDLKCDVLTTKNGRKYSAVHWGQPARKSLSSKEVKRKDREVTCMCSFTTGKLGKTTEILAFLTSWHLQRKPKRPHEALDSDLASNT